MSEAIDNARNLRAIGQDLEARGISQFELMPATEGYLVRIPYGATRPDETIETIAKELVVDVRDRVGRWNWPTTLQPSINWMKRAA